MLDDLRQQTGDEYFSEGGESSTYKNPSQSAPQFLGMTPVQRFVIAVMVLMMICILGSFFLVVTDKIYLPFF